MKRLFLLLAVLFAFSCRSDLPVLDSFGEKDYILINQDSSVVKFPSDYKGKISVVGYIFTNCPDICPLTTNNMRLIQQGIKEEGIRNISFVGISFDPKVDRPFVLKKYAEIRNLDMSNWDFLTGDKEIINDLMRFAGIFAVPGDSTITSSGQKIYFYVHTDRISLVDEKGMIRKNYSGSTIDINEIISDIKNLND